MAPTTFVAEVAVWQIGSRLGIVLADPTWLAFGAEIQVERKRCADPTAGRKRFAPASQYPRPAVAHVMHPHRAMTLSHRVSRYMITNLATVGPEATLTLVARILEERRISAVPVVSDGALLGVVSRTDLVRIGRIQAGTHRSAPVLTLPEQQVSDLLRHASRPPLTVEATAMLRDAARAMSAEHVHRLFVLDEGKLVGVISTYDLVRAVRDARVEIPISEIMSTPLFTINAQQPISAAVARLENAHVSGLVVVDDDFPVGVFTQLEALEARDLPRDTRVDEVFDPAMLCLPSTTKAFRAAEQACRMEVRRVIPCRDREAVGIVTGLDFAKLVAAA